VGRDDETLIGINFGDRPADVRVTLRPGTWVRLLDSAEERWGDPGTVAPAEFKAASEVTLTLTPTSVAVFAIRLDPITNR
jgi:hypothetical protein